MRGLRVPAFALAAACAALLAACAGDRPAAPSAAPEKSPPSQLDRALARLAVKGDWDRALRLSDSALASGSSAEREIATYWKAVAWLYCDAPDSALSLLEGRQSKWTAGTRKVHANLLLKLAREASATRAAGHPRPEESDRPVAAERVLQDRVEALQKESSDLRAENQRLETEKSKYQKLLKDLETIR